MNPNAELDTPPPRHLRLIASWCIVAWCIFEIVVIVRLFVGVR